MHNSSGNLSTAPGLIPPFTRSPTLIKLHRRPEFRYDAVLTCMSSTIISPSPLAAASRLAVASPPSRMRTPLPSNTHGPASLRGVIGPSGPPSNAGFPEAGDGVLVSPRPVAAAAAPEDARAVGIAMGLTVAFAESCWWALLASVRLGREPPALLRVPTEGVVVDWALSDGTSESTSIIVSSTASGESSCAGADGTAGRALLVESRDFAAVVGCCAPSGPATAAPLAVGSSEAPSCSLGSSSEASCSHSSGSSTSASRSAAARQLGQMKIG
jgi:hypothetical protein